jgi:NRPS condensation-like uncharacterized protein
MIKYFKQVEETPNIENLELTRKEVDRSEALIKYYEYIINNVILIPTEKAKIKQDLENEKSYLKEAQRVRIKIATTLSQQ